MKFCAGSTDGMALALGVSGVECAACVGRMCIGSREGVVGGLGSGTRIQFCGKWVTNKLLGLFHYPPHSVIGRLLHSAFYNAPPLWCHSGTLPLDSPPLNEHVADW